MLIEEADKLRGIIAAPFSARRQDLPSWIRSKMAIGRLPRGNTAYIKGRRPIRPGMAECFPKAL
jgi:hypothetical protein